MARQPQKPQVLDPVSEYAKRRPLYEGFSTRLRELLHTILDSRSISYHVIESRAKTLESFGEKVSRGGKNYSDPLTEVTDLCGCRIIVYYNDHCLEVADIIRKEFDIVEEELSHQPQNLEADRFGYISSHYIIRMTKERANLIEWQPYKNFVAELQIRTVIQHAWSAVSHAVQYKEETSIPSGLQRRLFRIAGLFELADEEFVGIRDQQQRIREEVIAAIDEGVKNIPLTVASIEEIISRWKFIDNVKDVARKAGIRIKSDDDTSYKPIDVYDLAIRSGITTANDLELALNDPDVRFFDHINPVDSDGHIWGIGGPFFAYLMLMVACRKHVTKAYLVKKGFSAEYAERIMGALRKLGD